MLDDPLAHLKRQVQSRMIGIPLLKLLHDPQRVQVVIEAPAVPLHQLIQLPLSRVTERWMPDVMHQRQRFDQLRVQPERGSDCACNLRYLECVSQPVAKMIRETRGENLRFRFQPAKRARVYDAIAVPRIFASISMRCIRIAPASRLIRVHGPRRESGKTIDASLRFLTAGKNPKNTVISSVARNLLFL